MFLVAVSNFFTVFILGVVLLWSWVAFIAAAIARRTGRTSAVPYPDEVLWARFDRSLLDRGLFGGAPVHHARAPKAGPSRVRSTIMVERRMATEGKGMKVTHDV